MLHESDVGLLRKEIGLAEYLKTGVEEMCLRIPRYECDQLLCYEIGYCLESCCGDEGLSELLLEPDLASDC